MNHCEDRLEVGTHQMTVVGYGVLMFSEEKGRITQKADILANLISKLDLDPVWMIFFKKKYFYKFL